MRSEAVKLNQNLEQDISRIHGKPVFIDVIINSLSISALIDLGCTIYSVFSKDLVKRLNLPRTKVHPKELRLAKSPTDKEKIIVDEICWAEIDLEGNKSFICGYVIEGLTHELILGEPWMRLNSVIYRARDRTLFVRKD